MELRMKRIGLVAALFGLSALAAQPALALTATQTVERMVVETLEDGSQKVTYVAADRVKPGEEVIYRLSYENDRDEPASNVALTMPVPEDVNFIEGSAIEPGTVVTYSVDGGATFGALAEGTGPDVTHIRWQFEGDIAARATGDILFKAILK